MKLSLLLVLFASISLSQDFNATLRGTVQDATGAIISGATVEITSAATGITRTTTSNERGEYIAAQLPAQTYVISAGYRGFQTQVRREYTLQVGQDSRLNFTLSVGQSTERVEVSAEASLIQSDDHNIGAVVDEKKVKELPLNGRNAFSLALLAPNVFGSLNSSTFSVAGNPSVNNNYSLDGVQNNDRTTGSPTHRPSVDGIQEFRVLTGTYAAEYGRQSGGQVIMTTKSGSNDWHGTAYEFFRNNHLDSRGFFSASDLPPFTRNQYGGSLGGPIQNGRPSSLSLTRGLGLSRPLLPWQAYQRFWSVPAISPIPS